MAMIEIDRLRKVYPGSVVPAVDDLDLHVQAGEFITLLGPSGSGKTTTLMLLAGFETPTSGTIRLDGRPIETLPPHRRGMGVVFQSYSLFPQMTVAQNVAFPLSVRKMAAAAIRERVTAALSKVQLAHLAERKPQQLSGGQQQRVALARALVFEPRVVLMDEPLSALDKHLREEMQLEIRRLHRELGVTMVFVTHDQTEAMTLSDRVAVFNHGRIEQLASPQQLYDTPSNPFVAGFVGDNNMLGGRAEGGGFAAHDRWQLPARTLRRQHGGGRGGDAVRAPRTLARGRRRRCRQPLAGDAGRRHSPGRSLAAGRPAALRRHYVVRQARTRGAAARAWRPGRTCRWPSIASTPGCLRRESGDPFNQGDDDEEEPVHHLRRGRGICPGRQRRARPARPDRRVVGRRLPGRPEGSFLQAVQRHRHQAGRRIVGRRPRRAAHQDQGWQQQLGRRSGRGRRAGGRL
jgi:ABC-type Fe3+/spermidine/putrescine transport system ATPase subunit